MKNNAPLTQAKVEALHNGGDGRLRRARRSEGRDHQQSGEVPLRSCGAVVQGRGWPGLPDRRRRLETVKIVFGDVKTKKGEVIWTGLPGRHGTASRIAPQRSDGAGRRLGRHSHPGPSGQGLRLAQFRSGRRSGAGRQGRHRRSHVRSFGLQGARREAAAVPRAGTIRQFRRSHTVLYYKSVLAKMGKKQDDWMRLYMEPGMAHCGGGIGPDQFNKMGVIERWREAGPGSGSDPGVACHGQHGGHDAPAVSLSAGCGVQGRGEHQRRGEFLVQVAVVTRIGAENGDSSSGSTLRFLSRTLPDQLDDSRTNRPDVGMIERPTLRLRVENEPCAREGARTTRTGLSSSHHVCIQGHVTSGYSQQRLPTGNCLCVFDIRRSRPSERSRARQRAVFDT